MWHMENRMYAYVLLNIKTHNKLTGTQLKMHNKWFICSRQLPHHFIQSQIWINSETQARYACVLLCVFCSCIVFSVFQMWEGCTLFRVAVLYTSIHLLHSLTQYRREPKSMTQKTEVQRVNHKVESINQHMFTFYSFITNKMGLVRAG